MIIKEGEIIDIYILENMTRITQTFTLKKDLDLDKIKDDLLEKKKDDPCYDIIDFLMNNDFIEPFKSHHISIVSDLETIDVFDKEGKFIHTVQLFE